MLNAAAASEARAWKRQSVLSLNRLALLQLTTDDFCVLENLWEIAALGVKVEPREPLVEPSDPVRRMRVSLWANIITWELLFQHQSSLRDTTSSHFL